VVSNDGRLYEKAGRGRWHRCSSHPGRRRSVRHPRRATSGGRGLHHHPIWVDTRFCESTAACPDSWLDAQVYESFVTPVYY